MIHYITPTGIASAWVANEIDVVRRHGVPVKLHSLWPSKQKFFSSDWAKELDASTNVIYPVPPLSGSVSVLVAPFIFGSRFFAAMTNAIFGKRENLRNRVVAFGHFLVACHWARKLRGERVDHIHSQWIHSGGTVGMYGAWLLGVPFSFTGHAADLFRERVALEDKVRRADFIVCISRFHEDLFLSLGAKNEQLHIVYCGIDITHFVPRSLPRLPGELIKIVSSGRLVEKKGFAVLIEACTILKQRNVQFRCLIGGDGPQEAELRKMIKVGALEQHVTITGRPLTQEGLPEFMHSGHIYALPCVWAKDGDVDGLPQMLMEAMACGLPVISTKLVGIPDLIEHERSGLLVESGDAVQLADAIQRLIDDPALARRLAEEGGQVVRERFEINTALQPLIRLFEQRLAASGSRPVTAPRGASPAGKQEEAA